MKDLKITKGAWELHKYSKCNVQNTNGRLICSTASYSTNNDNGEHILENEANAALICEAGNVYNETRLTPRELVKMIDFIKSRYKAVLIDYYASVGFSLEEAEKRTEGQLKIIPNTISPNRI